jgi:hypothetical protein
LAVLEEKIIGSILEVLSSLGDVAVKNFPDTTENFYTNISSAIPRKNGQKKDEEKVRIFCYIQHTRTK